MDVNQPCARSPQSKIVDSDRMIVPLAWNVPNYPIKTGAGSMLLLTPALAEAW